MKNFAFLDGNKVDEAMRVNQRNNCIINIFLSPLFP